MDVYIGLDVGTTSIKAVAFDENDNERGAASRPTPTNRLADGGAEYDAEELWNTSCTVIREVVGGLPPGQVAGIAVASMGEAGVLVDTDGRPLAPMIAWFDTRSQLQAEWWADNIGIERTQQITGLTPKPAFGVTKMLWTREHLPDAWSAGWRWLNVADWIAYRLSGQMRTDFSIASRNMLLDVAARSWSDDLLADAQLDPALLAPLVQSGEAIGTVTELASERTGLPVGMVVGAGGQDHVCAALALGITEPGMLLDSIGTAEALLLVTDDFDPTGRIAGAGISQGVHVEPGRTYAMTGFLGGGRIDSEREQLGLDWPEFLDTAEADAVINEIAQLGQNRIDAVASAAGLSIDRQLVTGGGSRIEALIEAKRNRASHELHISSQTQATAWGAAILARRAARETVS